MSSVSGELVVKQQTALAATAVADKAKGHNCHLPLQYSTQHQLKCITLKCPPCCKLYTAHIQVEKRLLH